MLRCLLLSWPEQRSLSAKGQSTGVLIGADTGGMGERERKRQSDREREDEVDCASLRVRTINSADQLFQCLHFPLDPWLGEGVVVLEKKRGGYMKCMVTIMLLSIKCSYLLIHKRLRTFK